MYLENENKASINIVTCDVSINRTSEIEIIDESLSRSISLLFTISFLA